MTDLIHTTITTPHHVDTIQAELKQKGYYLANAGQTCDDAELATFVKTLGGFWQQGTAQVVAPLANPTFIAQTTDEIPPHNECAYDAQPPHYLLLHCQENQVSGGDFYLVDSYRVLNALSAEMHSLLYHTKFQCLINPTHPEIVSCARHNEQGEIHLQYSCIGRSADWSSHSGYIPVAPFYQGYETIILTLQAQLKREELRERHSWTAGDLLIFDNRRFLHGRYAFQGFGRKLDHLRIQ